MKIIIGYQEITNHFIFDVDLGEHSRRKSRLVCDRYKTKLSSSITYSLVILRYPLKICLIIESLNQFEFLSDDIENDHLTAPC